MSVLLASTVDAAVVLALALGATILMRRQSAASRHAVLAIGIVTALAMPVFELLLPQVPVITLGRSAATLSQTTSTFGTTAVTSSTVGTSNVARLWTSWPDLLLVVWIAGATLTSAGLVTGLVRLRRLRRRCTPLTAGPWRDLADSIRADCGIRRHVRLLQSDGSPVLLTSGLLSPAIVLPPMAIDWPEARKRIVLRHELAHVQRHDAAIQLVGEVLRIAQWPNPLVWLACRSMRQESEYACDDAVLGSGVDATDYASQLLEVARHLARRDSGWAAAPAIAHRSTLERRIVVMLHRQRNHAPLGRRGWAIVALAALGIAMPLAAAGVASSEGRLDRHAGAADVILQAESVELRPAVGVNAVLAPPVATAPRVRAISRQATATLGGTIVDQSGGVMPGVEVTITDARTGSQQAARTDARGGFAFRDIPASEYGVSATLPGFATFKTTVTLQPGAAIQQAITLPLGSLFETVSVHCSAAAGAETAGVTSARGSSVMSGLVSRIRVGKDELQVLSVKDGASRIARLLIVGITQELVTVVSAQEQVPVKVGGNVRPPRKIYDVKPACPPRLPAGNTVVKVTGRVDVEGLVRDLAVGQTGAEFSADGANAALDAVRQWKFTPTLLNGQPVEVLITVQVTFVQQ